MFYQTDDAIRAKIESLSFSPYVPVITGFLPSALVEPSDSEESQFPSIAISKIVLANDLMRYRHNDYLVIGYDDDDAVIIDYPGPWVIGYQIDVFSSQNRATANLEMNRICEQIMSGPPVGFFPGTILNVRWDVGFGMFATGKVEVSPSENPQIMTPDDDGRLRVVFRLSAKTWKVGTARKVGRMESLSFRLEISDYEGINFYDIG